MTTNYADLKEKAEAAKAMSLPMLEFIQKQDNFKRAFTPEVALELIARLERAEKVMAAVNNLIKVKGRHHTAEAFIQLVDAMKESK